MIEFRKLVSVSSVKGTAFKGGSRIWEGGSSGTVEDGSPPLGPGQNPGRRFGETFPEADDSLQIILIWKKARKNSICRLSIIAGGFIE